MFMRAVWPMTTLFGCSLLSFALMHSVTVHANGADSQKAPTTKFVMQRAMKSGLCKKVAKGEGSQEDIEKLLELFEAMAKNPAPKGSPESWKKLTGDLVRATRAVMNDEPEAAKRLHKAANCSACHKPHRPKK